MRAALVVLLLGLVACGLSPYGCEGVQQVTAGCAAACGMSGVARIDEHGCFCRGAWPDGGAP